MFMPIYNSYWHGMSVHVFMLVMTTTTKTVVETETPKKWTKKKIRKTGNTYLQILHVCHGYVNDLHSNEHYLGNLLTPRSNL